MDSDERTSPPTKGFESSSYAEEAGEHIYNKTVFAPFDYKAKFHISAPNKDLTNANSVIERFNRALYEVDPDSGMIVYKQVTLYYDHNRIKIVGYPSPIDQPTEFYRRDDGSVEDSVQVELKIRVSDPTLCVFSTEIDELYGGG